jgi:DNA-binding FadR family transcriptional regulator
MGYSARCDMSNDLNFVHLRPKRPAARVADRVAHQIALELLDGQFQPGWRLPPEKELMEELGCSRQALRGALRLLEAWGLVTVKMGREGGPVIRRPEPADMIDQLAVLVQYEGATVSDVYTARRAIEPMIAEAAARNATEAQIVELEGLLERMSHADDASYDQYQTDVIRFSSLLGEAAGLVMLAYFLDALTLVTNSWIMPKLPFDESRRERLRVTMSEVLGAIRRRDPAEARAASLRARLKSEDYWAERLPEITHAPIISFAVGGVDPRSILPDSTTPAGGR